MAQRQDPGLRCRASSKYRVQVQGVFRTSRTRGYVIFRGCVRLVRSTPCTATDSEIQIRTGLCYQHDGEHDTYTVTVWIFKVTRNEATGYVTM